MLPKEHDSAAEIAVVRRARSNAATSVLANLYASRSLDRNASVTRELGT
jgi:hypothetical protein